MNHNAKSAIHENKRLTIGEQKNAIQNLYNPLLTEFRHMTLLYLPSDVTTSFGLSSVF